MILYFKTKTRNFQHKLLKLRKSERYRFRNDSKNELHLRELDREFLFTELIYLR